MAKSFTIKQVAVGPLEWDVWLLDSNGRLWSPTFSLESGLPNSKWASDTEAGAIALAVDGQRNLWVINPEGKIFSKEPTTGLGMDISWVDESLKDSAGHLVKATQISAGDNTIVALDDQKRIWQRSHAVPGRTGSGWTLNTTASNVKWIAAGNGDDIYCVNDSGTLYRFQGDHWTEQEAYEGHSDPAKPPTKMSSASAMVNLELGRSKAGPDFYRNLFYLGSDGHMAQPGRMAAVSAAFYRDAVGTGVDFAVSDVNDVWMINADGDVYRRTGVPVTNALATGNTIPVTVQGDAYSWIKISGPDFSQASIYWIQPGDTFDRLAADLGTTPAALHAKNLQIADTNHIKAGEPLHLY